MKNLIEQLHDLSDIKAVKREGDKVLKLQLFTKEIPGTEAVEIRGDLRSISQKIVRQLDNAQEKEEITRWNWIQKPEKKYQETSLGKRSSLTDRKEKGHKPGYYKISIE